MSQPAQQQEPPGTQAKMTPRPDCGEQSYVGYGRLDGKVAIITGGDSGIGRAVAIAYAREGADVVLSYLDEHEDAKDTAQYVEQAGRRAVLIAGDIADPQHCRDIVDTAVHELGKIDVLVNNAAFQMNHESLEEIPDEEWDHTWATNVSAMFHLCKAAVPNMAQGGAIIGSSSVNSDSVRCHQGRDRQFLREPGPVARSAWHPGQQRRARPDLDAADPRDDAAGEG
jgi:nucleoside-diphosphate-sugar epimerase